MKFKHHVSNSDKNEDPLKTKKSLDKALMTGQQKSGTNMYSTGSPHTQQKGEEKGITHTKNRFQKPPKRTKIFKKGLDPHEDHTYGQRKMSKETNDLSKPFQERKRHRGKEKNH